MRRFSSRLTPVACWISAIRDRAPRREKGNAEASLEWSERADRTRTT
jgi:hypothetical protein